MNDEVGLQFPRNSQGLVCVDLFSVFRFFFTPPKATNTGPGFNLGPGGGARGCDFKGICA